MALPTVFAACTADDIVSENGMQQAERAKLSKDFVLNVNNGVESRYAVEGTTGLNFVFEEGDKIGANLIDVYADRADDEADFDPKNPATWEIINTVSPALPFINEGGVWKSANEELGIGNYLFTNPFNPADKNRAAASYELPVVVKYSSENPNAHIEAYNKAVAADILREGDSQATLSLKNIFAYPKIRINFDKNLDVKKVTKVVLARCYTTTTGSGASATTNVVNGTPFIFKGAFNHKRVADMFNPELIEEWLEENKAAKATEADYWAQFQTSHFIIDEADFEDKTLAEVVASTNTYADIKTTPYFIYEMDETVVANSIDVRFMIPSIADLSDVVPAERITMYVCTDKGNFEMELTSLNNYQFSETTLAAQKRAAMQRNTSNTLRTKANALVDSPNASIFFNNVVSTAADWNKLVEEYGDLKKYSAEYKATNAIDALPLYVNIISDAFALTSDLKMPEVAEFIIKTNVNVEGEVTLKNILVQETGKLIVKKGATLTTDATLDAANVEVEEGGNLVFTAVYDEDDKLTDYDKIETICNHGTVTVPAGVEATFTLNNADKAAVLNVGAAASRAAEVAAVANLAGYNYGIINNYGVINAGGFVNNAPAEHVNNEKIGYKYDAEKEEWNAVPTVNNFATFNAKGSVTNYGLFVNNSVLTSNFVNAAEFINATVTGANYVGTLEVKAGAETYIDSNEGAEIILAELTPAKGLTIYKARKNADYNPDADNFKYRGTIKYTLNEKSTDPLDLSNSPVNYLVANTDVEIGKTYTWTDSNQTPAKTYTYALKTLEVTDGIVTLAARTGAGTQASPYKYPAIVQNMIVNGEVDIDCVIYKEMLTGDLTVMPGGVFGVPAESLLEIALSRIITKDETDELDKAIVSVVGTLKLTDNHPNSTTYGDSTWPKGSDQKYTAADFKNKNIEINKDAEVKCTANTAPSTTDPNKDATINVNGNLYDVTKTGSWYANKAADAVWTTVISGSLNMELDITATTSTTDKNIDYAAVLSGAKEVQLAGANVSNLKSSMGLTSTYLNVTTNSTISGSANMVVWKVDKLNIAERQKLNLDNCWIEINVVAQVGMGCEVLTGVTLPQGGNDLTATGKIGTGKIVAKDVNGEYLQWNLETQKWMAIQ